MTTLLNFLAATLTGLLLVGGLTVLLVVVLGWSRERHPRDHGSPR